MIFVVFLNRKRNANTCDSSDVYLYSLGKSKQKGFLCIVWGFLLTQAWCLSRAQISFFIFYFNVYGRKPKSPLIE